MNWSVYSFFIIAIFVSSCSSRHTNDDHWTSVLCKVGVIRVYYNQNLISSDILSDVIEVDNEQTRKQEEFERYYNRRRKLEKESESTDRAIYEGMNYADEYLRARGQKSYIMPISPSGKRYYPPDNPPPLTLAQRGAWIGG